MSKRAVIAALLAAAATLAAAAPAYGGAQTIRIREAELLRDGSARIVVSLGGDARQVVAADVRVTENGRDVGPVKVSALDVARRQFAVALAIDESGSTAGAPIANAKAAATAFVQALDPAVPVSVVSFADTAVLRSPATRERSQTISAINGVTAKGATALYDGIALAAESLHAATGLHAIVVFSDGRDSASKKKLADAIFAANDVKAPISAVALKTKDSDAAALAKLAADTRGSVLEVAGSADLAGAFRSVATELSSQIEITYTGSLVAAETEIAVAIAGAIDSVVAVNPRRAPPPALPKVEPPRPPVPALAGRTGLYVGVGATFAFLAIFGGLVAWRSTRTTAGLVLDRGVAAVSGKRRRGKREAAAVDDDEETAQGAMAGLGRAAAGVMQHVPNARQFEKSLQSSLERAGWPMRASEFVVLQLGAAAAAFAVGWALLGRWYAGAIGAALAGIAPQVVMSNRITKRQAAFIEQLPDTLQLLAGSLSAGYGFMQAIDTLVKECPEPTHTEFNRVLTEARLGMPPEDAMSALAERVDNDDFRWVVLAINIQRQVGGNLSELLKTVAATLRGRAQVRRQIKVLSAEGRLSAIVLGVMPFAIAAYMLAVNPKYIGKLFANSTGQIMLGAALGIMGLGVLWLRKIIRIDV